MRFILALHTDNGTSYGVTVPDLPGCFSAGDTFEEALEMAREAITGHAELLLEDGGFLPEVRPLAEHQANPDYAGAVWAVIEVPVCSTPVKQLLQDETKKHALIGHLPRQVAVMYRGALARIEELERSEKNQMQALAIVVLEFERQRKASNKT